MRPGRLLATDLDRTLLPNGADEESAGARPLLAAFVAQRGLRLAYVTGRRVELVRQAIAEYDLPEPDWILADVGSTLYERSSAGGWEPSAEWAAWLAEDWRGRSGLELAPLFAGEPGLELQEAEAQRPFKLSFFVPLEVEPEALRARMSAVLERERLRSVVVYSVDEAQGVGLVDVLPARSAKLRALEHLMERRGFEREEVVFAGDSGNDLEVLVSHLPAVLVANADADLRARVHRTAAELGTSEALHLARGGQLGMNGNYAAGILEGWLHFHPEDRPRLEALSRARAGGDR